LRRFIFEQPFFCQASFFSSPHALCVIAGWIHAEQVAQTGLSASLLVRNPETHALIVKSDPPIYELMRETKVMSRLGLEVPESAKTLGC
jgi:hypothetical protein